MTVAFSGCSSSKSYNQAKEQTIQFFNDNQDKFTDAKNKVIEQKSADNVSIENIRYIDYDDSNENNYVFFDYGAQGMLGGQYWGIYYSSDNTPKFAYGTYGLTEATTEGCYFWQESGGNNYYATERISENWFFYYMDYDGNTHGLSWNPK